MSFEPLISKIIEKNNATVMGLDPILDALIAADQAEKLRRSESSDKS